MHNNSTGREFETLLNQYNKEIDTLKEKLLNGESWDNLVEHRNNVTRIAAALHKSFTSYTETPDP